MTTTTNWPDPTRPGVPMFPERDGWHIVVFMGSEQPMRWRASTPFPHWLAMSGKMLDVIELGRTRFSGYIGPCLTPAQIAELLAGERERCVDVCNRLANSQRDIFDCGTEDMKSAYRNAARKIHNLGAAS